MTSKAVKCKVSEKISRSNKTAEDFVGFWETVHLPLP